MWCLKGTWARAGADGALWAESWHLMASLCGMNPRDVSVSLGGTRVLLAWQNTQVFSGDEHTEGAVTPINVNFFKLSILLNASSISSHLD